MNTRGRVVAAAVAVLLTISLSACSGGGEESAGGPVTLRYAMWDAYQAPIYEKCAQAFQQANPNIKIKIEVTEWGAYWGSLATNFIADTAPDVFVDHLAKYPEFARSKVIEPVDGYAQRDGVDADQYLPGLADLWRTPDGKRYGFPKDWDTVAIAYNKAMLRKAGVTEAELRDATWNPQDGGTFERIAARLATDRNGRHGDQPGFDPDNVAVYGIGLDTAGLNYGQTTWAGFARSLGFELLDRNPWGERYNYGDARLVQTMAWWRHMIQKGYLPSLARAKTLSQDAMFAAGKVALAIDGSWSINALTSGKDIQVGFAPQPKGREGSWSMFNGLADSIWSGGRHKEQAWQWMKFLASSGCQNVVGASAVVFPAIPEAAEQAFATREQQSIDVSAFTSYVDAKHTLLYPITNKAAQIQLLVTPVMEKILLGQADPARVLPAVNNDVNKLLAHAKT
jgi:multiple sugar transport system substrate-binding protein